MILILYNLYIAWKSIKEATQEEEQLLIENSVIQTGIPNRNL